MSELANTRATDLPVADDLGPDPEPLGVRAGWLLERRASERAHRRTAPGVPAACPLALARGRAAPCESEQCPWYRVPGTVRACAVEQWSPNARKDPRVARWFSIRAKEIREGRRLVSAQRRGAWGPRPG